jgi:hypothetical protein
VVAGADLKLVGVEVLEVRRHLVDDTILPRHLVATITQGQERHDRLLAGLAPSALHLWRDHDDARAGLADLGKRLLQS